MTKKKFREIGFYFPLIITVLGVIFGLVVQEPGLIAISAVLLATLGVMCPAYLVSILICYSMIKRGKMNIEGLMLPLAFFLMFTVISSVEMLIIYSHLKGSFLGGMQTAKSFLFLTLIIGSVLCFSFYIVERILEIFGFITKE